MRTAGVAGLPTLTDPLRVLALQRTVGNAAVARLLQRQPTSDPTQVDLTGRPDVYMLKPPKAVHQNSLTCWAASLSAFLGVTGAQDISVDDIVLRYVGSSCIDDHNALNNDHAEEVFGEWAVEFEFFRPPHRKLRGYEWREKLRQHGHLIVAMGTGLGHVVVVYGSGFNDKGEPDPNWISVMDPLVGGHRNWPVSSVADTISVGWLTTERKRPAACLSTPAPVPEEPAP